MKLKAVLFDFDGVLVDSKLATIQAFQETLGHYNLPIPAEDKFKNLMGLKTLEIAKKLLSDFSDNEILPIYHHYRQIALKYLPLIKLIPGVKKTLTKLGKKYQLALITNRGKRSMRILLKKFQLKKYFQIIIDRDDISRHKPDPKALRLAMRKFQTKPAETIFIGDTQEDITAARRAKIACILLKPSKTNLTADYYLNKIENLPLMLEKINNY